MYIEAGMAWDYRGLSTDAKPVGEAIPNGSTFLEMDTGNVYIFDEENMLWREI